MNGNPWTTEQLEIIEREYPDARTADLVQKTGHPAQSIYHTAKKLGLRKSEKFWQSEAAGRLTGDTGRASRFQKGHKTWNTGMKGLQIGGKKTQFKSGNRPGNFLPVGSVVIRTDGYSKTKIGEPNIWMLTHWLTWTQAGNFMPAHPQVIKFKDGNKLNCTDINNLMLSTKTDVMEENSIYNYPDGLRQVIQLNGVLKRKINGK